MTLKLLQSAIIVKIPEVTLHLLDGDFTMNFSILFKRISDKERKLRLKGAMKSLKSSSGYSDALTNADVTEDELDAIQKLIDQSEAASDKLLMKDIVGWRDLLDSDGSIVPYNEETKAEILSVVPVRDAILEVWSQASGSVDKAVEDGVISKN